MRQIVSVPLPFDAEIMPPTGKPREVIVLLHGFMESGKRALSKMGPGLPEVVSQRALVIAPNAPFVLPIPPEKPGEPYRAGFSWYFYDRVTKEYYVDMETAVIFLSEGLRKLGVEDLPKRLIGYSQGGYLAPIAATRLRDVKQVIGISAEYLNEEIQLPAHYRLDGIHGELDEVVPIREGIESHQTTIQNHRLVGEFEKISGMGHKIDASAKAALRKILLKADS